MVMSVFASIPLLFSLFLYPWTTQSMWKSLVRITTTYLYMYMYEVMCNICCVGSVLNKS